MKNKLIRTTKNPDLETKRFQESIKVTDTPAYSTTEQAVDKWIDGSIIYRKVVVVTSDFAQTMTIPHGITNFGELINAIGVCNGGIVINLTPIGPTSALLPAWAVCIDSINNTNINVVIGNERASKVTKLSFILYYTKATT